MGHDVFISHSSKDKPAADAVCAALERVGVRCWVAPRDILPGANWATSILKAIGESRMMVLIFSKHTQDSQHIRREVERAVHHGIPIAPVRIDDVMPADDLEYYLSSSHWMDAMTPPFEQHLGELCMTVRTLLGMKSNVRARPAPMDDPMYAARGPRRKRRPGRRVIVAIILLVAFVTAAVWVVVQQNFYPPLHGLLGPRTPVNSLGMKFIEIEPGTFIMGSPPNEKDRSDDERRHTVTLTKAYFICTTEVTQAQWCALMASNPSFIKGDELPVESVSWNDAVFFCQRLSEKEKRKYRLPTEAEWEYACREAGKANGPIAGNGNLDDMAWYDRNSNNETHPVATKRPNALGLYDMHGNVREWCSDWYGSYPFADTVDPTGPATPQVVINQTQRVFRGGAFWEDLQNCRAAKRNIARGDVRDMFVGFRVCFDSE